MKNNLIFALMIALLALGASACSPKTAGKTTAAPQPLNQQTTSHEGETILLGPVNRQGFQTAPFKSWYDDFYGMYNVRASALEGVAAALKDVDIVVFMGTWCSDSQMQVPQFYKILDHLKFPESRLKVYAVDNHPERNKTTPGGESATYKIEFVPTFIFLRKGQELGRITEYPQQSLEADMAGFVK